MKGQYKRYFDSLFQDVPIVVAEGLLAIFCLGVLLLLAYWGFKKGLYYSFVTIIRSVFGLLLVEYVALLYCSTVIFRKSSAVLFGYNFQPFWSYIAVQQGRKDLIVEDVMNAVVFVPVGLLLGCAFRLIEWWKVFTIGVAISISIEVLQFLLHRGFAEFDDVFHNTLGCLIGYGMFVMIKGLLRYEQ